MAEILQILDQEFKITIINILRDIMKKVNDIQKHMAKVSREMEKL